MNEPGAVTAADARQTRESAAQAAAETVARRSYGKLIAFLSSHTRDVSSAEDALSEAALTRRGTEP